MPTSHFDTALRDQLAAIVLSYTYDDTDSGDCPSRRDGELV